MFFDTRGLFFIVYNRNITEELLDVLFFAYEGGITANDERQTTKGKRNNL